MPGLPPYTPECVEEQFSEVGTRDRGPEQPGSLSLNGLALALSDFARAVVDDGCARASRGHVACVVVELPS